MSLDTLLEAAEFLEATTKSNARVKVADFHRYAKVSDNQEVPEPDTSLSSDNGDKSSSSLEFQKTTEAAGVDKRRAGGSGSRIMHNKLEKNRRAHLKECFDNLRNQIPFMDDKKCSNLSILRAALRHIQYQKKKERSFEKELSRLYQEKQKNQENVVKLQSELRKMNIDIGRHDNSLPEDQEVCSNSTSTATGERSPIVSGEDDDDDSGDDEQNDLKTIPVITLNNTMAKALVTHKTPASAPVTQLLQKVLQKKQLEQSKLTLVLTTTSTSSTTSVLTTSAAAAARPTLVNQLKQKPQGIHHPKVLTTELATAASQKMSVLKTAVSANPLVASPRTPTYATTTITLKNPIRANFPATNGQGMTTVAVPLLSTQQMNVTSFKDNATAVTLQIPTTLTIQTASPNGVKQVVSTPLSPTSVTHVLQAVPSATTTQGNQLSTITHLMTRGLPQTNPSSVTAIPIVSSAALTGAVTQMTHITAAALQSAVRPATATVTVPVSQIINANTLNAVTQRQMVMTSIQQIPGVNHIISPGTIQIASPVVAQGQVGVFNRHMLKQTGVPTLIHPAFLPPQLVGQPQLMKPLLMVSMPNVVTVTSASTPTTISSTLPATSPLTTTVVSVGDIKTEPTSNTFPQVK